MQDKSITVQSAQYSYIQCASAREDLQLHKCVVIVIM